MAYKSLQEIEERCRAEGISFSEAVLLDDLNERGVSREDSRTTMHGMWKAMKEASDGYDAALRSNSGLVGGAGGKMREYVEKEEPLSGGFVGKVISSALEMGESNACMKRIVAAPTAGACGVLPAVLVNYQREWKASDEEIVDALYVAAGIGQVIASRAFIAGALGGCQAEIGSASAMAAGALVTLRGGNEKQISHAAAMALKNLLGLVCDPVGGLVEVPCVKRNVIGAVNALSAADMALAGIESRISPGPGHRRDAPGRRADASLPEGNRRRRSGGNAGWKTSHHQDSDSGRKIKGGRAVRRPFSFWKNCFYFCGRFGIIIESLAEGGFEMADTKNQKRDTYTIYDDEGIGTVQIADEVVAIIAGLAATEVEGVASMAGNITNELVGKLGMKNLSKGVKVDVLDGVVCVDLALNIKYGYGIPETSQTVQEKVKAAIENMTGLEVSDVNVAIAGVDMEQTK